MVSFGRTVIYTPEKEVTSSNLLDVLGAALKTHLDNRQAIDYLYKYYRGYQPILKREKQHRPEICNRTLENHALEIVDFKKGYVFGEPLQYVRRGEDEEVGQAISSLNEYMASEDKSLKDKLLAEWFYICGTAYRMVLPDELSGVTEDYCPFEIDTLDPRDTFVVYNNGFGKRPVMGVMRSIDRENREVYTIYTPNEYFVVIGDQITDSQVHALGSIPIIEYPANSSRLGAFEPVLPLLDALNNLASNRMDGVEQFIQSFLKFKNCDIDEEQFTALKQLGAIKVRGEPGMDADVDIISQELDQSQTQTLKDDLYRMILIITGMPDRTASNAGMGGDTGQAVMLREGWSAAEAMAKDIEEQFIASERKFLHIVARILKDSKGSFGIRVSNLDIKFTRNKTYNLLVKTQGLLNQLQAGIHPRICIANCDIYSDPEQVYIDSAKYLEKWLEPESEPAGEPVMVGKGQVTNE